MKTDDEKGKGKEQDKPIDKWVSSSEDFWLSANRQGEDFSACLLHQFLFVGFNVLQREFRRWKAVLDMIVYSWCGGSCTYFPYRSPRWSNVVD